MAGGLVALVARPAHADVAPPLTGVVDFLWLGPVGAILAGLLLVAGSSMLYARFRRRGRGRVLSAALGLGFFVVGNLACYLLAITLLGPRYRERPPSYPRRSQGSAPNVVPAK